MCDSQPHRIWLGKLKSFSWEFDTENGIFPLSILLKKKKKFPKIWKVIHPAFCPLLHLDEGIVLGTNVVSPAALIGWLTLTASDKTQTKLFYLTTLWLFINSCLLFRKLPFAHRLVIRLMWSRCCRSQITCSFSCSGITGIINVNINFDWKMNVKHFRLKS